MKLNSAFTILEVVIALSIFALIAIPGIGIAVLTIRNSDSVSDRSDVSDLLGRVKVSILNEASEDPSWFTDGGEVMIYSSQDLLRIEIADALPAWAYYEIDMSEPEGYTYSGGGVRVLMARVRWPVNSVAGPYRNEIWSTMAFSE